jgi:hypothetical protein
MICYDFLLPFGFLTYIESVGFRKTFNDIQLYIFTYNNTPNELISESTNKCNRVKKALNWKSVRYVDVIITIKDFFFQPCVVKARSKKI